MKLLGIEWADLDRVKKVLKMLHKLQTIGNDFGESTIKVYNKKGCEVEDFLYTEDFSEWCEKVYFITMKEGDFYYNWICYIDKDGGFRSYAGLYQFKSREISLTNNLEAFDLNCSYKENVIEDKEVNSIGEKLVYHIHLKIKCKHKTIFVCYTDISDNFYPIGIIHDDLTKLELKYDNVAR